MFLVSLVGISMAPPIMMTVKLAYSHEHTSGSASNVFLDLNKGLVGCLSHANSNCPSFLQVFPTIVHGPRCPTIPSQNTHSCTIPLRYILRSPPRLSLNQLQYAGKHYIYLQASMA